MTNTPEEKWHLILTRDPEQRDLDIVGCEVLTVARALKKGGDIDALGLLQTARKTEKGDVVVLSDSWAHASEQEFHANKVLDDLSEECPHGLKQRLSFRVSNYDPIGRVG